MQRSQAMRWALVLVASLWTPLLWMLIMINGEGNRPTSLFFTEWHFFGNYLFNPMLFLWFGTLSLSLSLSSAWRRVGGWVALPGVFSMGLSLVGVVLGAMFSRPRYDWFFGYGYTQPEQAVLVGLWVGLGIAGLSLLVWLQWIVAVYRQRARGSA